MPPGMRRPAPVVLLGGSCRRFQPWWSLVCLLVQAQLSNRAGGAFGLPKPGQADSFDIAFMTKADHIAAVVTEDPSRSARNRPVFPVDDLVEFLIRKRLVFIHDVSLWVWVKRGWSRAVGSIALDQPLDVFDQSLDYPMSHGLPYNMANSS